MMDFRHLKYFLEVARHAHFTRAARALHISQPTLSQQIGTMEKELGVPLFDRTGKTVRLTQAGELFRKYARNAVREMEDARVALGELEGLGRGSLRVGAVQTASAHLMPAIVARFNEKHPCVSLQIEELSGDAIEAGLLSGHLNLGVGFVPPASSEIAWQLLTREELVLVVGPKHRFAERANVNWRELENEPLALLSRDFCTRRLFDECAQSAQVALNVAVEMNSIEALLATVRLSAMATIVPALALKGQGDNLRAIGLLAPTPQRDLGLMWRKGTYRCAATRAFAAEVNGTVSR